MTLKTSQFIDIISSTFLSTLSCLDFSEFIEHCKLIVVDLSKLLEVLGVDQNSIQQYNFKKKKKSS